MTAKAPKNKPLRITCSCIHGMGRSPEIARRVGKVLNIPQKRETPVPYDMIHRLPSGEEIHLSLRRLYGPEEGMDAIAPPALTMHDISESDAILTEVADHRSLERYKRIDLIEAALKAQKSGKMFSDLKLSDEQLRARLLQFLKKGK